MLSEWIFIVLMLVFSSQSSSLLSSLLIIPMSIMVIISCSDMNNYSGGLNYLYVMIFIGGLLVLLVSVSSLSFQEQGIFFSVGSVIVSTFFTLPLMGSNFVKVSYSYEFIAWFNQVPMYMYLMLMLLCLALLVLTKLILSFKTLIRLI